MGTKKSKPHDRLGSKTNLSNEIIFVLIWSYKGYEEMVTSKFLSCIRNILRRFYNLFVNFSLQN